MEDVEEGCNVSGALPSSPGHAEQCPDPPKEITTTTTPTENSPNSTPTVTNGLPNSDPLRSSPPPFSEEKDEDLLIKDEELIIKDEEKVIEEDEEKDKEAKIQDNEDSNSNDSENSNKRKCDEDETPAKKLRTEIQQQYVIHDKVLSDYMESTGCNTPEELQAHSEQLLAEIRTLNELAREKEREWNNILHLKKVKEELLLRMQRKRQILLLNSDKDCGSTEWDIAGEAQLADMLEKNKDGLKANYTGLMMVPIVSSSPANSKINTSTKTNAKLRTILPKPSSAKNSETNNNTSSSSLLQELNGNQNECRQGRQGPILDVRSIIADYRQRHPETVPRRGRRLKSVLNSSNQGETTVTTSGKQNSTVLNMTSLGLGSGSQVLQNDVNSELGLLLSSADAVSNSLSTSLLISFSVFNF